MNNLLTDPLIRVRLPGGELRSLSLPEVFALLCGKTIEAFIALMAHQRHAWFAFLVQLAAISMNQEKINHLPVEAKKWRELLSNLTKEYEEDEPWKLVMEDVSHPAFFQPPVPEGNLEKFKGPIEFPDEIDILVTSKNHDIKMTRIQGPQIDHWIYALVTLQTMQGFLGQGNYGISRMNGGFASRPGVGITTGVEWGSRFRRDVHVLLKSRNEILKIYPHYWQREGKALLWLYSWDGKTSLSIEELDPFYIEVCRRIRFGMQQGRIVAWTTPTRCSRLEAKDQNGNMGDPWTPIKSKNATALTVSKYGFTYDLLQQILFGKEYRSAPCQEIQEYDPGEGLTILAVAMTRGQGKTEGFHERRIPIPANIRSFLLLDEGRDRLAHLAKQQVEDAAMMERQALRPALLALVQGGKKKLKFSDDRVKRWLGEFHQKVDNEFFHHLWDIAELEEDEGRKSWQTLLVEMGFKILSKAEYSLPIPVARRYRAFAAAERIYRGAVYNIFPMLQKRKEEE